MDDLREIIKPLIIRQVARQCTKALKSPDKYQQLSAIKIIKAQYVKYIVLVEEDMPLPILPQLLDLLEYNPLQRGSVYNTRSSTYKLEVERPNIKELKDGPTASYISVLAFTYC